MIPEKQTEVPLTDDIKNKVKQFAIYGGTANRLNIRGASYYSFTPYKNQLGKIDFCGGWDWITTLTTNFKYVYDILNDKFHVMEEFLNKLKK